MAPIFKMELLSENNRWKKSLTPICQSEGIAPDGDRMTREPAAAHRLRHRVEAAPVSRFPIGSTELAIPGSPA